MNWPIQKVYHYAAFFTEKARRENAAIKKAEQQAKSNNGK